MPRYKMDMDILVRVSVLLCHVIRDTTAAGACRQNGCLTTIITLTPSYEFPPFGFYSLLSPAITFLHLQTAFCPKILEKKRKLL